MRRVIWRAEVAAKGYEIRVKGRWKHRRPSRRASARGLGSLPEESETHSVVKRAVAGHAAVPGQRQTGFPSANSGADAG